MSWPPRSALGRALEVIREQGPRALWFKLWGELLYRRVALFELALDARLPELAARVPLEMGPYVDGRDDAEYAELSPYSDHALTPERLASGHSLFVARSGGRLVGVCWVARGRLWSTYLRREIRLAPDEALTYETYTAESARGLGVGPALRAWVAGRLSEDGCRRLLAAVEPENRPAIRLVEKLGYRRIGTLAYLGAGRLRIRLDRRGLQRMRVTSERAMPSDDRTAAWDRAAERVLRRPYLDPLVAGAKRRAHLSLFERWLQPLEGKSLLKTDLWEEGVGGDELLFTLAREAREAHAIDVSPLVVARVRERAAELGVEVGADRADLRRSPFGDGQFDVIVSTSTIDHLDPGDQRQALAELRRVLAPSGALVVTVDNPDNATDWLLRAAAGAGLVPFPLAKGPTLDELRALLVDTGFRPERHEYIVPAPRVVTTAAVRLARLLPDSLSDRAVAGLLRLFERVGRRAPRRLGAFVAVLAR